jgi:hypothetical protein
MRDEVVIVHCVGPVQILKLMKSFFLLKSKHARTFVLLTSPKMLFLNFSLFSLSQHKP